MSTRFLTRSVTSYDDRVYSSQRKLHYTKPRGGKSREEDHQFPGVDFANEHSAYSTERGLDDSILADRFFDPIKACLSEMQRDLDENEQQEVGEFLPLGKTVTVESVGYENPVLVMLHDVEHDAAGTVRCSPTGQSCRFSSRPITSHWDNRDGLSPFARGGPS